MCIKFVRGKNQNSVASYTITIFGASFESEKYCSKYLFIKRIFQIHDVNVGITKLCDDKRK